MKELRSIFCDPESPENTLRKIENGVKEKVWMQLISPKSEKIFISETRLPLGPGVIIRSGGSTGRPHQCLIPCSYLDQSAIASANWIKKQGLNIASCQIFNSLPLSHISGLMAWWRSRYWHTKYISIKPSLMRSPNSLEKRFGRMQANPKITSLVPVQVNKLLKEPAGIRWLQSFSIIWLGGSLLPEDLASTARNLNIRLAPCYGATETTAMIAVQSPNDFLIGNEKYSNLLEDVELKIGKNNRLEVKTPRLAQYEVINGKLKKITNDRGWWESGDAAEIVNKKLRILGRVDTAINSGGETVYPEILQIKLLDVALKAKVPIEECFLVPIDNKEWGQKLVALIRIGNEQKDYEESKLILELTKLVKAWPPYERPCSWYSCPELKRNAAGKWESNKWKLWLKQKHKI